MASLFSSNLEEKRIILVGRTGAGKSATGNTLLGRNVFLESSSGNSITKLTTACKETVFSNEIRVVDTPGLFDTEVDNTNTLLEMTRCLLLSSPGPHVVALVMAIGRFTPEIRESFKIILNAFGEDILSHMMVIFTRKDELDRHGKTIEEFITQSPPYLKEVVLKCGNRYLAVNNLADGESKINQQKRVIDFIDGVIQQKNGQYYSNAVYASVTEKLQERLEKMEPIESTKGEMTGETSFSERLFQKLSNNQDEIIDFIFMVAKSLAAIGFQMAIASMAKK